MVTYQFPDGVKVCDLVGLRLEFNLNVKTGVVAWLITGTFTRICCIRTGIGSDTYRCDC